MRCQRCGFCCHLDVRLTNHDIKKIKSLGFHEHEFIRTTKSKRYVKKFEGRCMFLEHPEKNPSCMIYSQRPDVCRSFPKKGDIRCQAKRTSSFSEDIARSISAF
jgi:Fe-S-cluster containining protein